jgi:p-cumate 2,3-dioxygenase alpha subunit
VIGSNGTTALSGAALVDDNRTNGTFRVDRRSMTSPDVFAREKEMIFDRCWLYIGHGSEVARPGDYVRRSVMGRELVFIRGQDDVVRCFFNTCPHRGAQVCREDRGNTKRFQCFYHAWTFNSEGALIALPDEGGYSARFDRSDCSMSQVPHLDHYRGFWFISYATAIEPLGEYLDEAKEYLDLVVDQSESGMRVLPGTNEYSIRANWKLLVENSIDGYHALPLHQTYFAYVKSYGGGIKTANLSGDGGRQLGHGHVVLEGEAPYGRPIARWDNLFGDDAKSEIAQVRARLVERHGEDRTFRMADTFRNVLIFPNLIINDITAITIRYFEPLAPDLMHVSAWALAPVEETDGSTRLARRINSYLTFIGPGGFATPDDVEALESCQIGFRAGEGARWSDISRGMTQMPGPVDELQMRAFWRAWAARLDGGNFPARATLPEAPLTPEGASL